MDPGLLPYGVPDVLVEIVWGMLGEWSLLVGMLGVRIVYNNSQHLLWRAG